MIRVHGVLALRLTLGQPLAAAGACSTSLHSCLRLHVFSFATSGRRLRVCLLHVLHLAITDCVCLLVPICAAGLEGLVPGVGVRLQDTGSQREGDGYRGQCQTPTGFTTRKSLRPWFPWLLDANNMPIMVFRDAGTCFGNFSWCSTLGLNDTPIYGAVCANLNLLRS